MPDYKFAAVLNKKVDPGKVMNALAHATAGLAAKYAGEEDMGIINYEDKDGGAHYASKHPFIILRAKNGNQIRTVREGAMEKGIKFASFTECMTVGGWQEQVKKSGETPEEALEYYGIVLFGPKEVVEDLTKKFSLWT